MHRIGLPLPNQRPQLYYLVIDDHLKIIDPENYNINDSPFDPGYYFITSGDAVEKCKAMIRSYNDHIKKHINNIEYTNEMNKQLLNAKILLEYLKEAKGEDCFLETEWDDHNLLCIPKNPRR